MSGLNLSDWAVRHRILILFFMIVCVLAGVNSYTKLGREEDPDFAVATMVVQTMWPGATTYDTMQQVTDRIEKKLEETPHLDYLKSFTKPGVSVVYVNLKDSTNPADIPWTWYIVRKKIADIQATLPQGVQGPYFNDEFGDVFGIIYGLTYDGFTLRQTRDFAETARAAFLRGQDVGKVNILGAQNEEIYLSIQPQKLAALGLRADDVMRAIAQQNAVVPSGVINTPNENILVEVSGALLTPESIESINLYINNRFYRLSDLATVQHGYVDPPSKMFRVNGKPAIGLGISMQAGGNNLAFGASLDVIAEQLKQDFPVGIDVVRVSDQPQIVREAIGSFTDALFEAVVIVLIVSFVSLGLRAGLVVALSIPLVLSIVFIGMDLMEISLQRISLGALIISLGLLVDDAMITVEMMITKIEEGFEKAKAATFAYTSTAFPMLTGTLVTIIGFLPIGLADSNVGQYCFSLFAVIAIALIASWFVAVIFSPVIGTAVLPAHIAEKHGKSKGPGRLVRGFEHLLVWCMRHRYLTIAITIALFALSLFGQSFIQRQFFPSSDRTELLVTVTLPKNASIFATETQVDAIQELIHGDPTVESYSVYIGGGAIRFYLPLDVQLDNDFIAQFVVVAKSLGDRELLKTKLEAAFANGFDDVNARVSRLELGPPVGWPIQYRASGRTPEEARAIAGQIAQILRASGQTRNVNFDWDEKNKAIEVVVNQDKARQVGLSSQSLAQALNSLFNGTTVTQIRDSIYLVDLVARGDTADRATLESLRNLQVNLANGASVPLSDVATLTYSLDDGYLWRRDRLPTITVQADTIPGLQAPTVYRNLEKQIQAIRAGLPTLALIEEGGTIEKSAQSNAAVMAQVPLMIGLMLSILMIQLQSFTRLILVVSVAPLGLIGVVVAMLTTNTPMGFVATLGIIALAGMIIRNSVILVDQIETNHAHGLETWDAVLEAAKHRLRPILLTASAAILGMIPIMEDVFWGPMAYAVVGGLAGATLLTLLFLPALYVTWFRVKEPGRRVREEAPRAAVSQNHAPA